MTLESEESVNYDDANPYQAPRRGDAIPPNRPGPLVLLFVAIASVAAGFSAFWCSCYGFMLVGHTGQGVVNIIAMLLGMIVPIPVAFFAARFARRMLLTTLTGEDSE